MKERKTNRGQNAVIAPEGARVFTVAEFMGKYGIGLNKTYQEIASGRLKACKVGRRTLVARDDAEVWLASLPRLAESDARRSA